VPQIVVVLAVVSIFNESSSAAMFALGILGAFGLFAWYEPQRSRSKRKSMSLQREFRTDLVAHSLAARVPRIVGTIIVQMSLFASLALLFQTGLEFLASRHIPCAVLGGMVAEAAQYIVNDPWMIVPPGWRSRLAFSLWESSATESEMFTLIDRARRSRRALACVGKA